MPCLTAPNRAHSEDGRSARRAAKAGQPARVVAAARSCIPAGAEADRQPAGRTRRLVYPIAQICAASAVVAWFAYLPYVLDRPQREKGEEGLGEFTRTALLPPGGRWPGQEDGGGSGGYAAPESGSFSRRTVGNQLDPPSYPRVGVSSRRAQDARVGREAGLAWRCGP